MARPEYEESVAAPGSNESSTGQDDGNIGWHQNGMPEGAFQRRDH